MKSKVLTALLCLCLLSSLVAGCSSGGNQEPAASAAPAQSEEPAVDTQFDGTYTASSPGYGGDVTATLVIKDGLVESFALEGADETAGIGAAAIDTFNGTLGELVGSSVDDIKDTSVDAVTGATHTSTAAQAAIADVLVDVGN